MSRIYLSYDPEQRLLLPPDLRDWLPEGHLALFISEVVDSDGSPSAAYRKTTRSGN